MKLQVTERRLEENRRNQEEDIINHIATDKIRIVFLRKHFMKNGDLRYDKTREKPRNN